MRELMRVPVPWVFVLTYLVGGGLDYALPLHEDAIAPRESGMVASHGIESKKRLTGC